MRYNLHAAGDGASLRRPRGRLRRRARRRPSEPGTAAARRRVGGRLRGERPSEKYTIYLSAVTIGNDWLQQMLRSAEVAVDKGPLAGRVDLKVETVEDSAQAQINSLNNIIGAKPDAIIVHANSSTALNPTIKRACARASSSSASAGGDRAVPLQDQHQLGARDPRPPDLAGRRPRRQGQDPRRPWPARLARSPRRRTSRVDDGHRAVPGHRDRRLTTSRTTRSATSRRASRACSRRTRRSTAS